MDPTPARGLELWVWQPHARNCGKATTGPLRFLGNPPVHMPCSSTPAGPTRQDIRRSRRDPRIGNDEGSREFTVFRGSIARPVHSLSTLRPGDCSTRTPDSLPAAVRSTGRDWLPAGFQRKVSELLLTSLPPFPSFPDAMPTERLALAHARRNAQEVGLPSGVKVRRAPAVLVRRVGPECRCRPPTVPQARTWTPFQNATRPATCFAASNGVG